MELHNSKLNYIITGLLLLLTACLKEDDVQDIFANGQQWHWSANYVTSNWDSEGNKDPNVDSRIINSIENKSNFIVTFNTNGTMSGRGQNFDFSGTWKADGSSRTIEIKLTPSSTPSGTDAIFFRTLTNAKYYRGDSRLLKLFDQQQHAYMLLSARE